MEVTARAAASEGQLALLQLPCCKPTCCQALARDQHQHGKRVQGLGGGFGGDAGKVVIADNGEEGAGPLQEASVVGRVQCISGELGEVWCGAPASAGMPDTNSEATSARHAPAHLPYEDLNARRVCQETAALNGHHSATLGAAAGR